MTLPVDEILAFWFGPNGEWNGGDARPAWFKKDSDFDRSIQDVFGAEIDSALNGDFDDQVTTPGAALALIIFLDQFTRNVFRNTPKAFAGDVRALALAKRSLDLGFDKDLTINQKIFLYLPLEHSESLADQERCVELMQATGNASYVEYAIAHREIITRFGRFPHRNAILGRNSTEEELAFLKQPGSSF